LSQKCFDNFLSKNAPTQISEITLNWEILSEGEGSVQLTPLYKACLDRMLLISKHFILLFMKQATLIWRSTVLSLNGTARFKKCKQ